MQLTLTHTRLLVADYPACFRFYRDTLGLEPTFGDEESGYADFRTGDVALSLFDRTEMMAALAPAVARTPDTGPERVALVFAVVDVHTAAADLQARGARLAAPPTDHPDWGIRTAHFRDPDGNLVEINQSLRG